METIREIRVLRPYTFDQNGTFKGVRRGELLTVSSREAQEFGDVSAAEADRMVRSHFAEIPTLSLEDDHV